MKRQSGQNRSWKRIIDHYYRSGGQKWIIDVSIIDDGYRSGIIATPAVHENRCIDHRHIDVSIIDVLIIDVSPSESRDPNVPKTGFRTNDPSGTVDRSSIHCMLTIDSRHR